MRQKGHTEISRRCAAAQRRLLFTVIFISCLAVTSRAASGDLDTTFGGTGIVITDVNNVSNEGKAMVIQPDGKIIVGGSGADLTMVRYNANGSLDPLFGVGGVVTYSPTSYSESIFAMALQPDGKIVVAGTNNSTPDGVFRFLVGRFNSDGTVDQSFGANGFVTVSLGTSNHIVGGLVVQSDGKILVAGNARDTGGNGAFALARFDTLGALDPTFDGDGKVITVFPDSTLSIISAVKVQSDGKIVAAGSAEFASRDFAAARYNTDGSLDTSFGTGGRVTTHFAFLDLARDLVIQPDGRIVLGGTSNNNFAFALARYDQNGALDPSFGNGGKVALPVGVSESYSSGLTLQPDGKLVAVGVSGLFPNRDATLVRFDPNGTVDQSFGTSGIVVTPITPGSFDDPTAIKLDSSGRILITGRTNASDPVNHNFFVVRYLNDTFVPTTRSTFDFDGDGKTDPSVYRPSAGDWYLLRSTAGFAAFHFGSPSDVFVPADYTGDGKTDMAVFRPSNNIWYVLRSGDYTFYGAGFGVNGDIPAPGDYDGDGRADTVVFRPSNGTWYLNRSTAGFSAAQFGQSGDVPAAGDFDGDGKNDISVYRPSLGNWYRLSSGNGAFYGVHFGSPGDMIVPADYTGDGKTDYAVFRPSTSTWYVYRSGDGSFYGGAFGSPGDLPSPGDYDGDGKTDIAVWRPGTQSYFYIMGSTSGFTVIPWGIAEDRPVANAYVH